MTTLNLDDFSDLIERPDGGVRRDAEERRERQAVPAGALGRLDELAEWLAAAQGRVPVQPIVRPRVVLFAADHGIAAEGVSVRPAGSAHELVRSVLDGKSPVAILAARFGASVRIVDAGLACDPALLPAEITKHRVRSGSGRIDVEDALTAEEAADALRLGIRIADEEADSGTDLVVLGDLSVGGTTVAATLVAALCGTDASVVTGRGGVPIDDLTWMRKCAAIRDALRRARPVLGDQVALLAAVGGADVAAITGFLLQSAVRRTSSSSTGSSRRPADWWPSGPPSGPRTGGWPGRPAGSPARPRPWTGWRSTRCSTTASLWEKEPGRCWHCPSSRRPPHSRRSSRRGQPSRPNESPGPAVLTGPWPPGQPSSDRDAPYHRFLWERSV